MNVYDINGIPLAEESISPEMYGAIGDGLNDDTSAIQSAVDSGGKIVFSSGKTYKITDTIKLVGNTLIDLNGATIVGGTHHVFYNFVSSDTFTGYNGNGNITIRNGYISGGCISFAHGENIRLENVVFTNCQQDHFLEIAGCKNYKIEGCAFIGMGDWQTSVKEYINVDPVMYSNFPWLPNGSAFYDGTKNDGITIRNCYFSLGVGDYAYGFNAFGAHSVAGQVEKHKNIVLMDNILKGFTGCGFRINDMDDVAIVNNKISVAGDGVRVGDVGQSTNVLIKGNVISASGTAVTKENNSTVFQSADNDINPTFT